MFDSKRFRKDNGLTQCQLAEILNCGQANISALEKTGRDLDRNQLKILIDIYGEEQIKNYINDFSNARFVGGVYAVNSSDSEVSIIDMVPVSALASFVENPDSSQITEIDHQPVILSQTEKKYIKDLYIIKVEGESMEPTVKNKAEVLARLLNENSWHNASGIVFVVFGDYSVIKRVKANNLISGNSIILSSDNHGYGEMTVQRSDIRAIFKAIRIISQDLD